MLSDDGVKQIEIIVYSLRKTLVSQGALRQQFFETTSAVEMCADNILRNRHFVIDRILINDDSVCSFKGYEQTSASIYADITS